MVGTSQRNAVWHLLRGNVLKSLVARAAADDAGVDLQLNDPMKDFERVRTTEHEAQASIGPRPFFDCTSTTASIQRR